MSVTTIYDVAKRAKVSTAAVSAVMNKKNGQVSPETRQRILDVVRELDYRPNRAARQLKTGKSGTIAVVSERVVDRGYSSPVLSQLISGIGDCAADGGLYVLLAPSGRKQDFAEMVMNMSSHGVDGAVVVGPLVISAIISAIENCGVPVVCIDSYTGFMKASTVDIDNYAGMKLGVEHLLSQGHRRITYFGHNPIFQCFTDRVRAFCDVVQASGLPLDHIGVRIVVTEYLGASVEETLGSSDPPTAVVCENLHFGEEAWEAITNRGLRVPEDVAMLVFDGLTDGHPGAELVSYVRPDPYEQGMVAAATLRKLIAGQLAPPLNVRLAPKVVLVPCPPRELARLG